MSSSAFIFVGDAPPPGSSILKFEIDLSSATLCPSVGAAGECQGSPQVSLISQPVEIELKQLELESAFLSLAPVPEGTYQGVKLTFASPELKIMLDDGTVQELEPPGLQLNPAMVTPTFDGGLMVSADTNFGFLIDINIFDSIQSSGGAVTGISPVVSLVELPAIAQEEIEELEDVTGKVANLTKTCPTGTFTLIESMTGLPIGDIQFNAETEFDDLTCESAAFANDQIVEVDLRLMAGENLQSAQFFAKEIEGVNPPDEDEVEGIITQVNSATEFVLLVQESETLFTDVPIGSFVTVTLDAGTFFRIDQDDLPVNPAVHTFASGDDLLAGQKVEVDVENGTLTVPTGSTCAVIADACTALAEKIKLKKATFTARVDALNDPDFTLEDLPRLFGSSTVLRAMSADCQACFVVSILVSTSNQTEFRNELQGFADLNVDDIVTVRGLLFKTAFGPPEPGTGEPELVARRVRRRAPSP
ncbi:MAG: hypothetical protein ACE5IP_10850 [Terriglobia bacterium]